MAFGSTWLYDLIDGYTEHDGKRKVFKFILRPNFEEFDPQEAEDIDLAHNRQIPGHVMQEVFERDKGKMHTMWVHPRIYTLIHKIPFSKGGSSKIASNIQLLCARHNLSKGSKLIY